MAISSLLLSCALFAICGKFAASTRNLSANSVSLAQGIPETVINPYCKFTVYPSNDDSDFLPVQIQCANNEKSPLVDNYNSSFYPVNYMQADNGSMSRAVEDAVANVKARFPNKRLGIRMNINGYHPLSSTKRYSGIIAVIDVSSKLTDNLGPNDNVAMFLQTSAVRFDPEKKTDRRLEMLAASNVVLLDWDYLVGEPSIYLGQGFRLPYI